MEIDVGDLEARKVEFTRSELVVTLAAQACFCEAARELRDHANGIHWTDLDENLSIAGMLKGQRS